MITLLGIIGATLLSVCGLPQAILSFKQKHSDGMSTMFLILWTLGEICCLAYVCLTIADLILIANYVFNLLLLIVIIYYKLCGRKS